MNAPNFSVGTCVACKKESLEERYTPLLSGSPTSTVLMIRYSVSPKEALDNKLWVDEWGWHFKKLMDDYCVPLSEVATAVLVRCPYDSVHVRHLRSCRQFFDKAFAQRKWKVIVCLGRDALKHSFMRGGNPPSLDTFKGRFVSMPETLGARLTVVPAVEDLTIRDKDDTVDDLQERFRTMAKFLQSIQKELVVYAK